MNLAKHSLCGCGMNDASTAQLLAPCRAFAFHGCIVEQTPSSCQAPRRMRLSGTEKQHPLVCDACHCNQGMSVLSMTSSIPQVWRQVAVLKLVCFYLKPTPCMVTPYLCTLQWPVAISLMRELRIRRFGGTLVSKRLGAKPKRTLNPMIVLDYRCYVDSGKIGTNYPPSLAQVSQCSALLLAAPFGSVATRLLPMLHQQRPLAGALCCNTSQVSCCIWQSLA
jgi:hypothetical protein